MDVVGRRNNILRVDITLIQFGFSGYLIGFGFDYCCCLDVGIDCVWVECNVG